MTFTLPFPADSVSSNFGPRLVNPDTGAIIPLLSDLVEIERGVWQTHDGIDYRQNEGTDVLCPADGTVSLVTDDEDAAGFSIHIQHGTGAVMSVSAHLMEKPDFVFGDRVSAGDVIGKVGSTGISSNPHLHFSTLVRGVAFNPTSISAKWDYYNSVDWDSTANIQEENNGGN